MFLAPVGLPVGLFAGAWLGAFEQAGILRRLAAIWQPAYDYPPFLRETVHPFRAALAAGRVCHLSNTSCPTSLLPGISSALRETFATHRLRENFSAAVWSPIEPRGVTWRCSMPSAATWGRISAGAALRASTWNVRSTGGNMVQTAVAR